MASIWFMETAIHRGSTYDSTKSSFARMAYSKRIHQISNITIKYETLVKGLLVDAKQQSVE